MNKILKKAFTLIELLVVIAIIGILSGLIIVATGGIINSANIAKSQVFSNSLRNALMSNLVSEWKFDGTGLNDGDNASTVYTQDTWSGGNNCLINGTPKVKTGSNCVNGSCLLFGGTTDLLNCGNGPSLNFSNGVTMAMWLKLITLPAADYRPPIYKGNGGTPGYRMGININGTFYAEVNDFSYYYDSQNTKLTTNVWYYIVATYDNASGSLIIYLNSVGKSSSSPTAGKLVTTASSLVVGGAGTTGINGLFDDVRLYNAAMPTSQIKEQYYAGLNNLLINGNISKEEYLSRIKQTAKNEQ